MAGGGLYEQMNWHIWNSLGTLGSKVTSNLLGVFCYSIEVALESIHDSPFDLAHILSFASIANNTVYHIVWLTGDVFLCVKLSAMVIRPVVLIFGQHLHLSCRWACHHNFQGKQHDSLRNVNKYIRYHLFHGIFLPQFGYNCAGLNRIQSTSGICFQSIQIRKMFVFVSQKHMDIYKNPSMAHTGEMPRLFYPPLRQSSHNHVMTHWQPTLLTYKCTGF